MLVFVLMTVVFVALGAASSASASLVERIDPTSSERRLGPTLIVIAAAAGVVAVLALVYLNRTAAGPDGRLVARLVVDPDSDIGRLMSYVTLLGDTWPSFTIATGLAIVVSRMRVHTVLSWVLPVLVLAELAIQLGIWKVIDDVTIGQLHPDVPIGGVGKIPSGSVARLFSVFATAALLCRSVDVALARRIATLGAVLVIVQAASRLALGRHLVADLVAGLALGVLLTAAASLLIRQRPGPDAEAGRPDRGPAQRPLPD